MACQRCKKGEQHAAKLTIGMATYDDFEGVYHTLQALRLYHPHDVRLLVVDNFGCDRTARIVPKFDAKYVRYLDKRGTAAPRDRVFRLAETPYVLCCDSHVMFAPCAIAKLVAWFEENPGARDMVQGPWTDEMGRMGATRLRPRWRDHFYGTWEHGKLESDEEPSEIVMHGLGVFAMRREAWVGFHPEFVGFGGEEGYVHEKVRRAGGRVLCAPWLKWAHRWHDRAAGPTKFPNVLEERFRNYVIGWRELDWPLDAIREAFADVLTPEQMTAIVSMDGKPPSTLPATLAKPRAILPEPPKTFRKPPSVPRKTRRAEVTT